MISDFKIKNYFSIKEEQVLSFEPTSDNTKCEEYCVEVKEGVRLLKIAIICGANASGKTNILRALSFFKDLMTNVPQNKTEKIPFTPFLLDKISRENRSEITMNFYLDKERYTLKIEFDSDRIYLESLVVYPGTQPAALYTREYDEKSDVAKITFGGKLGLSKKDQNTIIGNTINNCSVIAAFGKSNIELSRLNFVYDFFAKHINHVLHPNTHLTSFVKAHLDKDKTKDKDNFKEFIIDFLKASDFNITDLELFKEDIPISLELEKAIQASPVSSEAKEEMLRKGVISNTELRFLHQTEEGVFKLSEDLESRGTLRLMGIAAILSLLLENNKVISIDEVESSLHYELLAFFIKVFLVNSDQQSQLILTTHDINLLDEDFIRRDSIWFTGKDGLGQTHLTRLSSLGLHKNLSPYNAYKQGKLVPLPFMGSIYLNKGGNE